VNAPTQTTIDRDELVKLCAVDSELYARTFFSNAFRKPSPSFARDIWAPLEDPTIRLVNLICFRGSSKTTRLRTFASKRIAYGISRTVLYIGASERDAIRSIQWLRTQVERNRLWSETFGLTPGRKWEETQLEIIHKVFGHTVWCLAAGITGSLRGINFDDYRPDLIIVDDPQTDEMAATLEQREKVTDLLLGAVKNSLAPVSDEPNAKLAMAITPQHPEDISQLAMRDSQWTSRVFPCWTKSTIDLPTEEQISSWEEQFPSEALRLDKQAALARNRLSIFSREMECRLISSEMAQFRPTWLQIRETANSGPKGCFAVLGIDPVPPPSDRQMAKGLQGKDWEAQYVWGRHRGEYHLLDFARNRGHEPSWSVATALGLARKWRVARIVVDSVAYQRTLKWFLEQEMKRRGVYFSVVPLDDKMAKFARITNVFSGLATAGLLWIGPEHTIFAEQFAAYGPTYSGNDDDIDASAIALQDLSSPFLERVDALGDIEFAEVEDFPIRRLAP
jgi:phage terminase large subunit-like protein